MCVLLHADRIRVVVFHAVLHTDPIRIVLLHVVLHVVLIFLQIHVRVLNNTMEQFILNFVGQLIASTYLEPSQMAVIPIVNVLFIVGRILFWRGYLDKSSNHTNRSMGLPLSMYPSAALITYGIYKLAVKFL